MTTKRFQDIWQAQCDAARRVDDAHGRAYALDYLLGGKLMQFAETATIQPEFARELPKFVAEVRTIFSRDDIRAYWETSERLARRSTMTGISIGDERSRNLERFRHLKELLLAVHLGTS